MTGSSSPGNLFLFGEHAVVYGKPAIITSINVRAECKIKIIPYKKLEISSRELGEAIFDKRNKGNKDLFVLLELCKDLLNKFRLKKGIKIEIKSEIPVARGMSSSSAVLSSVLCCFSKLFKLNIKRERYYEYLIKYQRIIHGGKASGSEIISSSQGGFNYITFEKGLKVKNLGNFPFQIVIGDTEIETKTSKTVKEFIPDLMRKRPRFVRKCFSQIERVTHEGLKAVLNKDIVKIGKLMSENQKNLSELGLSHPRLDIAIKNSLHSGAYGAKLSGKGQGGVMLAMVDHKSRERVTNSIRKSGLKVIQTEIGVEGVK